MERKNFKNPIKAFIFVVFFSPAIVLCADVSLKEKISQLIMVSVDINEKEKVLQLLKEKIGGIQIQWGSFSLEDTQKFTEEIYKNSDRPFPFIAIDYEGGSVFHPTTLGLIDLPTNMMLGAANDYENTATLFYLAGLELRKAGINIALAPVLDINTNPDNPIIGVRSFSSNPEIVAKLGNSVINGFKAAGIMPVLKHFPGHGDTSNDSHKTLPIVKLTEKELLKTHILPFKKIIDNGNADLIMTAHILYPHLDRKFPASLSMNIMQNLLNKKLNYKGAIITDSLDMKAITQSYSIPIAAVLALKNGADILLIGRGDFFKTRDKIAREILKGNVPLSRLNEAYEKIMDLKGKYALNLEYTKADKFDMAYNKITKELSEKAITIIKNKDFLPLDKAKKITAIFFTPQRFSTQSLNFYKKLKIEGYDISYYNFTIDPDRKEIKKIKELAKSSEILLIGSFQWGGNQNKKQKNAIEELLQLNQFKILVSLMNPYDIKNYQKKSDVVILTYGITNFTMESLADILAGKVKVKGLLPINIDF